MALAFLASAACVAVFASAASRPASGRASALVPCAGLGARVASVDNCYERRFLGVLLRAADVDQALERIVQASKSIGPDACHGIMHRVARRWAELRRIRLAKIGSVLPRSHDSGCTSGFAHGLINAVTPEIDPRDPRTAVRSGCGRITVRFHWVACVHGFGHAFARLWDHRIGRAIAMCRKLREHDALNCSDGVLMDYWMARASEENLSPPAGSRSVRQLCDLHPPKLVQLCWRRAVLHIHLRDAFAPTASRVYDVCGRLTGQPRHGCMAGISALAGINFEDPRATLALCAQLARSDQIACADGTRLVFLPVDQPRLHFAVLTSCRWLHPDVRGWCIFRLAFALELVSRGRTDSTVCRRLAAMERRACHRGVARARARVRPLPVSVARRSGRF